MTASGLFLTRHLLSLMQLENGKHFPADGYLEASLQVLQSRLQILICILEAKADANRAFAQQRSMQDIDRFVQKSATF